MLTRCSNIWLLTWAMCLGLPDRNKGVRGGWRRMSVCCCSQARNNLVSTIFFYYYYFESHWMFLCSFSARPPVYLPASRKNRRLGCVIQRVPTCEVKVRSWVTGLLACPRGWAWVYKRLSWVWFKPVATFQNVGLHFLFFSLHLLFALSSVL